ncbi:hypothetical protein M9H77_04359 [Catharanthus roseus]|uniref:Uncharacterized protein n=1 Tax=Catharanthus roseus TaxID=4058 RepID=A0ACC0CDX7_CATRO|nr:hypothetical protein M9H77_04359 [Catharanthus roseus]
MTDVQDDPLAPLSAIWCISFDCSQLLTHTLVTYRDQLDCMLSNQFVWLPYHDRGLVPSNLWRAEIRGNGHTYWGTQHASHVEIWHKWRLHIRDGPTLTVEVLSYPSDKYIRWIQKITREVDDMGVGSEGRGLGDLGSSYQVEPFDIPDLNMPSFSLGLKQPTQSHPPKSYASLPPGLGFSSFQSPHPPGIGSSSFQAPLAPRTGSSSF